MAVWLLLVMLTAFAANAEDLSDKNMIFLEETNTDFVKLTPSSENFAKVTICLRFMTDLMRDYTLFSLATSTKNNAFLLIKDKRRGRDVLRFHINNGRLLYEGLNYTVNKWHNVCATWDSDTGVSQIWFDGMPTIKKYASGPAIASPFIVIGQDQDSFGGGFKRKQSFVGNICDLHMWDHVITPCAIKDFMEGTPFNQNNNSPGNLLNWEDLTYQITGRVLVEDKINLVCYVK